MKNHLANIPGFNDAWERQITSSHELLEMSTYFHIKDLKIFNKDTIPLTHLRKKSYAYIINLDKETGPGTHWTCISKHNDSVYYFDSYGFQPPQKLADQLKKVKTKNIINFYSSDQIQGDGSQRCGFYCLMALSYDQTNPKEFADLLDQFKDPKSNDAVLKKLLNMAILRQNEKTGGSLIDWVIDNLPFEIHVPQLDPKDNTIKKSNFIGPGTQMARRTNPDGSPKEFSKPMTDLDTAAFHHDTTYYKTKDSTARKKADAEFVKAADKIKTNPDEHAFNRLTAYITSSIIKKLGNDR